MKFTFNRLLVGSEDNALTVYYDGMCKLCIRSVEFIRRFDHRKRITYVPLQYSKYASENGSTVIFNEKGKVYLKSDAVLHILKYLRPPVSWLFVFIVVPGFIRDFFYSIISRNRHKWFGRCEPCKI